MPDTPPMPAYRADCYQPFDRVKRSDCPEGPRAACERLDFARVLLGEDVSN